MHLHRSGGERFLFSASPPITWHVWDGGRKCATLTWLDKVAQPLAQTILGAWVLVFLLNSNMSLGWYLQSTVYCEPSSLISFHDWTLGHHVVLHLGRCGLQATGIRWVSCMYVCLLGQAGAGG